MLHTLHIVDDFGAAPELNAWRLRLEGVAELIDQNVALYADEIADDTLYQRVRASVGDRPLLHCLLFGLHGEHETELHQDVGEYSVIYFPHDCPTGPLRIVRDGVEEVVEVRANRLVYFDCAKVSHQQVVPRGGVRYSVVFKFRG